MSYVITCDRCGTVWPNPYLMPRYFRREGRMGRGCVVCLSPAEVPAPERAWLQYLPASRWDLYQELAAARSAWAAKLGGGDA